MEFEFKGAFAVNELEIVSSALVTFLEQNEIDKITDISIAFNGLRQNQEYDFLNSNGQVGSAIFQWAMLRKHLGDKIPPILFKPGLDVKLQAVPSFPNPIDLLWFRE